MLEFMSEARPGGRIERAELSLYDAMVAEICGEQEARLRKFERTHYVRNDGKAVKKDRRDNRSRLTRYFDRDLDNRFPMKGKFPEMTIRKYRAETRERIIRADYNAEIDEDMEALLEMEEHLAWLEQRDLEDFIRVQDEYARAEEIDELNEWLKWA